MAAAESTLVPVAPDDTVDSILRNIRSTGAASVELLVPDDTAALQAPRGFERLRQALDAGRVELLVISSDEQTIAAARRNQIATVVVQGVRVRPSAPSATDRASSRYTTQMLPAIPIDVDARIDARDAAFLDALDQVPAREQYADLSEEDAELYDVIDDLPDDLAQADTYGRRRSGDTATLHDDELFADELDSLSDSSYAETVVGRAPARDDRARGGTGRRYTAADMDMDDEPARTRGGRTASKRSGAVARRDSGARGASRARATPAGRQYDDADTYPAAARSLPAWLLALALAGLIVIALAFWLLSSRVTVAVSLPAVSASERPFTNEVIPLVSGDTGATGTAVQAVPATADAEATVEGRVESETLAPTSSAKGQITIINTIGSAVPIPRGAEFIGKNDKGQEVRLTLDADVTVPGATTTTSLTGTSTNYGQISVNVTARSPGAASNVPDNTITQLLIPGQQPIVSQNSNFIFQHGAITGGSDQAQRIVTENEVQGVLQEALTQLYNNGLQQLSAQIDASKSDIDPATISPSAAELGDPTHYELVSVEPAIGQPVDPTNPVFKVMVRARFAALATPSGKPVQDQLGTVVRDYFQQRDSAACKAGEIPSQDVTAWRWDGEKLTIDGTFKCTPNAGLVPGTEEKVRDAVRGQSREAADAGLQRLQQQGLIGGYTLPPDRSSFPRFGWLIGVQAGAGTIAAPQTTTAQPLPTQKVP
jgi:hypothetical protein